MINVTKGWPNGSASETSLPAASGVDIVEGDFVVVDSSGALKLAVDGDAQALMDSAGGQALDTNTQYGYDVRYSGKVPVVLSNYEAQTDRFLASGTYTPGTLLRLSSTAGQVTDSGSGAIVGVVLSHDATNGIITFRRS